MKAAMPRTQRSDKIVDAIAGRLSDLSSSLATAIEHAQLSDQRPLALSRTLSVDKNITWKLARLMKTSDVGEAFQHLPGEAGFEIFMNALLRHGATRADIEQARLAYQSVASTVKEHAGDKQTLEILLDGANSDSNERLLVSRKLAFRGNSGIWGVQARTRINTAIILPGANDPNVIDLVAIGGWIDFLRTRDDAQWTMFRRTMAADSDPAAVARFTPIDPSEPANGPMLIRPFCSASMPPINVIHEPGNVIVHTLAPSPVGKTGAFNCFYGSILRGIGERYASKTDDHGEVGAVVAAPVEQLQFDLLVHRSLGFEAAARASVYGSPSSAERRERDLLPLTVASAPVVVAGTNDGASPQLASPTMPAYGQLLEWVAGQLNVELQDLNVVRFTLEYPPFPSTVVVKFPLTQRS